MPALQLGEGDGDGCKPALSWVVVDERGDGMSGASSPHRRRPHLFSVTYHPTTFAHMEFEMVRTSCLSAIFGGAALCALLAM
jgi:hypothetical protein